jgi:hypothetical protein
MCKEIFTTESQSSQSKAGSSNAVISDRRVLDGRE